MDKQTAKEILSAYRPDGIDALDENLKEPLALAEHDPELKAWFETELETDRQFAAALKAVQAPQTGKKAILATALFDEETDREETDSKIVSVNWWRYAAVAAVVTIAALFSFQHYKSQDPDLGQIASNSWLDSVQVLADAALPLDKRGDEIATLNDWLAQNEAPISAAIPASLTMETDLAGCRIFDLPNGKKASLLCFAEGSKFVHVFVVRKSDLQNHIIEEQSWQRKGDWNLFAWTEGDMLMTVASKEPAESITPLLSNA